MDHKVLGKGSYGTVFSTDDKHAIKQTSFNETSWVKETLITNYLYHPNIINFLDVYREKGLNFLSKKKECNIHIKMNIYRCLRDIKISNDNDIILIMRDVANALAYCHLKKILHRDVKECNILLKYKNRRLLKAYLTDFGLSLSSVIELNLSSNVVTATHRPPEVIQKKKYDERIDTWGFGMTVIFLITGRYFMYHLNISQEQFVTFVLERHNFLSKLQIFINDTAHRGLKHTKFYSNVINQCLKLYDERPPMKDISRYINSYISSIDISLPSDRVTIEQSLFFKPMSDIKKIITGDFSPRVFDKRKWGAMEKNITYANPLCIKLVSLTRVLVHYKETQIFMINPSTSYAFASMYLILESILLDTLTPIDVFRRMFSCEQNFNAEVMLNTIYDILKLFHFNMVEMVHYYINEMEKITKKSQRRTRGQILSFHSGILWGC